MKHILWGILFFSFFIPSAMASSMSTYPMRIELEAGGKIGNMTVFNTEDKVIHVQVHAMKWLQDKKSGVQKLEETKELIFFPRIFSIEPNEQQIIRIGYKGDVLEREKSFRLFVRELPVDEPGQVGARFAIQISSPVFIYPKGAVQPTKPMIKGIEVFDGQLMARIENHGLRYYSMHYLDIIGKRSGRENYHGKITGWYVLAGSSKLFPLEISRSDCLSIDSIVLTGVTKKDKQQQEFQLDKTLCEQISKAPAESS